MTGITDGALHDILTEMHDRPTEPGTTGRDGEMTAGVASDASDPEPSQATAGDRDPRLPHRVVTRGLTLEYHDDPAEAGPRPETP